MRRYVIGYYNNKAQKDDFVILATTDAYAAAMFIRESYNEAYKKVGMEANAILLASNEVPKHHRFSD